MKNIILTLVAIATLGITNAQTPEERGLEIALAA